MRSLHLAVLVGLAGLVRSPELPAQLAAAAPPQSGQVVFQFEESKLSDAQRAKLARVLAADLPVDQWPTIVVKKGDSVAMVVDRYFDVYAAGKGGTFSVPLPETTRMLTALIQSANGLTDHSLKEGQTLKLPPVPARAKSGTAVDDGFRAFSVESQTYARWTSNGKMASLPSDLTTPVTDAPALRNSRFTFVAASASAAAELSTLDGAVDPLQTVDLELLAEQGCPPASDGLRSSPYFAEAVARLAAESGALATRTTNDRIRIIDFDFSKGHGREVTGAAKWLLTEFGLSSLHDRIEVIELNPAQNQAGLNSILAAYFAVAGAAGVTVPEMAAASLWVLTQKPAVGKSVVSIPATVVQAAIYDGLEKRRWMSWSWRIASPAGVLPAQFGPNVTGRSVFVTVAAGNELAAVRADLTPQGASSVFREVANVTYGSTAGDLYGSKEDPQSGGRVDVLAAGCGFPTASVTAGVKGSSLSSPVVLTAAWIKHWLDNVSAKDMRRLLIQASLLSPKAMSHTGSAGVFDPARLMLKPKAHFLNAQRSIVVPIVGAASLATNCGTFTLDPAQPGTHDFVVYVDNGSHKLLRRESQINFPFAHRPPPCVLTSLTFSAMTTGGLVSLSSPQDFITNIGHLTF